jgi:DNA polymerase-3 subunit epsilon
VRYIVLDTETTGLSHEDGDRIIEIGAVEVIDHVPTGRVFHEYINPEREIHPDAIRVHGITNEFVATKPVFAEIAPAFVDFIQDAFLVIHNAPFDVGFLNSELGRLGYERIREEQVIDTLELARKKHPLGQNSLDALCRRYGIDNSKRTKHGALLDAELLADVYVELIGGRQPNLSLVTESNAVSVERVLENFTVPPRPRPLKPRLLEEEIAAHEELVKSLGGEAVWLKYPDIFPNLT